MMRPPAAPAIAIVPALHWLRGLVAALAGFAAVLALALLADQLMRSLGLPPPAAQPMPELGRQALASWLRAACLFACGVFAGTTSSFRGAAQQRARNPEPMAVQEWRGGRRAMMVAYIGSGFRAQACGLPRKDGGRR